MPIPPALTFFSISLAESTTTKQGRGRKQMEERPPKTVPTLDIITQFPKAVLEVSSEQQWHPQISLLMPSVFGNDST